MSDQPAVRPTPHPVTFTMDVVEATNPDGTRFMVVLLEIAHAAGTSVFFLEPDDAKMIANQLVTKATEAKAKTGGGLIVPRLGIIPNGDGQRG